jgi:hypothetical protein
MCLGPAALLTVGMAALNWSGVNYARAIDWSENLYGVLLLLAVAEAALCFWLLRRSPQPLPAVGGSNRSASRDFVAAVAAGVLTILPLFVVGDAIVAAFASSPGRLDGKVVELRDSNSTRNSCTKLLSLRLSDLRTVTICYKTYWARSSLGPPVLEPDAPVTLFVRSGRFGTVVDAVRTR